MVYDHRNLQPNYMPVLVTNIPFFVLYAKNEVAAKIVRVYMPMLWVIPGRTPYKSKGDARRKIKIKPLREANVGVSPSLHYVWIFTSRTLLNKKLSGLLSSSLSELKITITTTPIDAFVVILSQIL